MSIEVEAMNKAVNKAITAWSNAPLHFRTLGAGVVGPILDALAAVAKQINVIEGKEK